MCSARLGATRNTVRVWELRIAKAKRRRSYEFVKTGPLALVPFVVVTVTMYVPAGALVGEIAVIEVDPTTNTAVAVNEPPPPCGVNVTTGGVPFVPLTNPVPVIVTDVPC